MKKNNAGWSLVVVVILIPFVASLCLYLIQNSLLQNRNIIYLKNNILTNTQIYKIMYDLFEKKTDLKSKVFNYNQFHIVIENEESKFNINNLMKSDGSINKPLENIINRFITDEFSINNKVAFDLYSYLKNNKHIYSLYEISHLFNGIDIRQIEKYFTLYSNGKIDMNSASIEIVESLSLNWFDQLEPIFGFKKRKEFRSIKELKDTINNDLIWDDIASFVSVDDITYKISIFLNKQIVYLGVFQKNNEKWKILRWNIFL